MKSARPKVLHEVAGRSMLAHVLAAAVGAGASRIAAVIGPDRDDVAREVAKAAAGAEVFVQAERLGTAHAVLAARPTLEQGFDDVVVAFGDTPLVTAATFGRLRAGLAGGAAAVVLGFEAADPTGYGRLVSRADRLVAIREERDASAEERRIRLCNAGVMALSGDLALAVLEAIGNQNAKGEYYLTDAVEIVLARGGRAEVVTAPESEVLGVNDRAQLAAAEAVIQGRLRAAAMAAGVSMVAPETVFLSWDTQLGPDVVIEPHVVIRPGVRVADDVTIRAFSHLEGAEVARGAIVGPFARLRPGASLGPDVHVGNFVEVKNSRLDEGVKANHLAYLGDADVGAGTNVGAGVITCNYDGVNKHRTSIGARAFVGTNASLVAPVTIGEGAYIGSGSVVTEDVPPGALALGRGRQVVKEGWATRKSAARKT